MSGVLTQCTLHCDALRLGMGPFTPQEGKDWLRELHLRRHRRGQCS